MAKQTIRSKGAYGEELKDRQAQPPIVDNDLIVYQDGTKTAGSTVSNNNESDVQPLDKNYDPNVDLNPAYLSQMDMNTPIKGANQSFSEYGDDSSRDKQSTPGGENAKYTGENTKNSDVSYNPDIKTGDLNPYYVYGRTSQVYGTMHPGYISQRNDNIASALYNEGKRSKEEVEQFLSQQQGWMDSSELDRQNTIESIWKRIGDIAKKEREIPVAPDLIEDTSGKIYGKTTAEEGNPKKGIDTLADANSVLTSMRAGRTERLQEFLNLDPAVIATCLNEGVITWNEQTWRDAEQYNPEFIAEVKAEQKKQLTQKNMNAISEGGEITTDTNGKSNANNSIVNFAESNATGTKSSVEITRDVHNSLAENQTANEASETMAAIEEDMAILKNRLKNLKNEAQAAFKGDVPDYLVKAYINNKTQEIQNQMSILEDRYNAAYNRYKTEIAQTQWEKEYKLKQDQLQLQRDELDYKKRATEQQIAASKNKDSGESDSTSATNEGDTYPVTTLSDEEVSKAVDTLWDMYDNGEIGNAQCAAGIQKYYLPMLGITLPNLSDFENKKKLINEDENYVPKRGDLIILSSKSAPKNGHIGIVLNVLKDGTIEYMDWNGSLGADGKGTEKVGVHGINPNSNSIKGYRNINKGYAGGKSEDNDGQQWSDYDYANFEAFLDTDKKTRMSKTEKEAMAEQYGTDVQGMTQIAKNALANREVPETETPSTPINVPEGSTISTNAQGRTVITTPEGETITYAPGITSDYSFIKDPSFDPVLGYDTSLRDLYERVIDASFNVRGLSEEYAGLQGRTPEQLGQEARNYKVAKDNGTDAYLDPKRKVSRDWGFSVEKKAVYSDMQDAIAKGNGKMDATAWKGFIKQLGLDENDDKSYEKAREELDNYVKRYNETMKDESMYRLINSLEYIIMQDASYIQRRNIMSHVGEGRQINLKGLWGEEADWAVAYNYIMADEIFKKLTNTKAAGATLYPVSDKDMEMVRDASTILNGTTSDYNFKQQINKMYKDIREYIGKPISNSELADMWNKEGEMLWIWDLFQDPDFSNYLTINHARYSGLFGGYNYGSKNTQQKTEYNGIGDVNGSKNTNQGSGTGSFTEKVMGKIGL